MYPFWKFEHYYKPFSKQNMANALTDRHVRVLCSVKRSMAVDAFMQQVLLILSAVLRSSYLSCTLSKNIPDYPHSTCSWKSTPALIWADMEQFRATLIAYPFERSFIWHVLHLHALTTRIRHSSTKKNHAVSKSYDKTVVCWTQKLNWILYFIYENSPNRSQCHCPYLSQKILKSLRYTLFFCEMQNLISLSFRLWYLPGEP